MKDYIVSITLSISAKSEEEALTKFWERVDDSDYICQPSVELEDNA